MTGTGITPESLTWACKRIEDFYSIHKNKSHRDLTDAVTVLREGYGLDDSLTERYVDWIHGFIGEQYDEPMLLGLLVGVMASEHKNW